MPWSRQLGFRPPPHRLLRLLLMAGGAAAGLCLVLGLVALMITIAPPRGARPAGEQATRGAGHGGAGGNGAEFSVGQTITMLKGNGGDRHAAHVDEQGVWGIAWRFRCPPGISGEFVVRDFGPKPADRVSITATGGHESGLWWDMRGPAIHNLQVMADCPWQARVVLPRDARGGQRDGQVNHASKPAHPNRSRQHSPPGHRRQATHGREHGHSHNPGHRHSRQHRR